MKEKSIQYQLIEALKKRKITLAVAESLTGGLISAKICEVSGTSQVFLEGIISYSNESKITRLGVDPSVLKKFSAVSEAVAMEMAEGVRSNLKADLGLSSTGVAGPDPYDDCGNPRGLFYIGVSYKGQTRAQAYQIEGSREYIREEAANQALSVALSIISEEEKKS